MSDNAYFAKKAENLLHVSVRGRKTKRQEADTSPGFLYLHTKHSAANNWQHHGFELEICIPERKTKYRREHIKHRDWYCIKKICGNKNAYSRIKIEKLTKNCVLDGLLHKNYVLNMEHPFYCANSFINMPHRLFYSIQDPYVQFSCASSSSNRYFLQKSKACSISPCKWWIRIPNPQDLFEVA